MMKELRNLNDKSPIGRWRQLEVSGRLEVLMYLLILVVSLGVRLWDLGERPLHYDELLHAWYSWIYAEGSGFAHTPVTHGPFLFNITAFKFVLFGSSDFTARLAPVIFGVILVGMPYFLRKELEDNYFKRLSKPIPKGYMLNIGKNHYEDHNLVTGESTKYWRGCIMVLEPGANDPDNDVPLAVFHLDKNFNIV